MSVFIWNDRDWDFLAKNSEYDKSTYVVVRKLFVQWIEKPDSTKMCDVIQQEFSKIGAVKIVERLEPSAVAHDEETESDISEGYFTFIHSKAAYQVFMAHREHGQFPIEVITVVPADSWHQCDFQNNIQETKVDEETIARLSMLDQAPIQLGNKLLIDMGADISLKIWLSIARSFKENLEYILLKFAPRPIQPHTNQNSLTVDEYQKRLIQVLAKNCIGQHFQAMSIVSEHSISSEMLRLMAPLLKPLISLIVNNPMSAHMIYELPKFCPHLRMLRATGDWNDNWQDTPIVNWPSLKILMLMHRRLDLQSDTEDGKLFQRFIELNPQLEVLGLDTIIDIELLHAIVLNLRNIHTLSFARKNFDEFVLIREQLTKAKSLQSISIRFNIAKRADLGAILNMAELISQMKDIKLVTLTTNYMPNTQAQERFGTIYGIPIVDHRKCGCHFNQPHLNFDGILPDLAVEEDVPILAVVINTNNPNKSQDKSLKSYIQSVLDGIKSFFTNVMLSEVIKEENRYTYVHIATQAEKMEM